MFKRAKDKEEEKKFKWKRDKFREALASELRSLGKAYSILRVESEPHIQNIKDLAERLGKSHAEILNGGKFLFGVAQKALNIYLKYLWCANLDIRPPHCPFDNKIISALKPTGVEVRWTYSEKDDDYREWVRLAEVAAKAKGFDGPFALSEWEICNWPAIQVPRRGRRAATEKS